MIEFIRKIIEWLKKLFGIKPQEVICMGTFDDCNTCPTYPDFDENQYYMNYLDLAKAKQSNSEFSALEHWCKNGRNEGRSYKLIDRYGKEYVTPSDWDASQYAKNYNQIAQWGSNWPIDGMGEVNVLDHYAKYGQYEGKIYLPPDITDWEDEAYLYHFKDEKPPISASEYANNPLQHYYDWGFQAGWKFKPDGWSSVIYLKNNTDIAAHEYYKDHPLEHWWKFGEAEGRSYSDKPQEIVDFKRVSECDNPTSIYFSAGMVDGDMQFGEYGLQGSYTSKIWKYPHTSIQEFQCESVFDIKEFNGKYYHAQEHGRYTEYDNGMVYQWNGTKWIEVFRNPNWVLAFNLHVHNGYLYVTGSSWAPMRGGIWRTSNGTSWEEYCGQNDYVYWGMTTHGNDLWICGAYGADYGDNNSHPAVYVNKNRVYDDYSSVLAGYLGIASFNNDVFLGQANPAKIVRYSDKKTVLDLHFPTGSKFTKLIVDEHAKTLFAVACKGDDYTSGAVAYATKDGSRWYNVGGAFSVPHIFNAYYEPSKKEIWLCAGKWSQGSDGFGRMYRSVRK